MLPILYLDYDGILHPADVRVTSEAPLQPRVYVRGEPTAQPLFRYLALLELLLAPYPDLRIVLSTSWVRTFGYEFAVKQLSAALQLRVIGATTFPAPTRFDSIVIDAEERGLTRWLALDDDLFGWPQAKLHLVVAPTNPVLGLAQPGVAAELATKLKALCAGTPLDLVTKVDEALLNVDSLWALPGITEAEVIDALEEDARVHELLRQARARPFEPLNTAESNATSEQFRTEFRQASAIALVAQIESKGLINGAELAARLDISGDALRKEIESGQLFFISSADGEPYYPAFFADEQFAKGALSTVSLTLGELPGPAKFHFLTSKSTRLGQTPLEALAGGRLAEVLVLAEGFRER